MISVVVPLFNEIENLQELQRRLLAAAPAWQEPFEVVFVDDGSSDGSADWCRTLSRDDPRFRLVVLSRNFGHQAAIFAGLDHATGDRVVVLHADLQDPPETIQHLLAKLREGYDVAYGVRKKRRESFVRQVVYSLSYRLWALLSTDVDFPLNAGDFCALDRSVVRAINALPEKMRFFRGLRRWVGFRQIGVEYAREARFSGSPKVGWTDLLRFAAGAILDFSEKPLHALILLGTGSLVAGGLLLALLLTGHFATAEGARCTAPGSTGPWVLIAILFATGFQLIGLGIIAAYLGRNFRETKGRPGYVVREVVEVKPPIPPEP